MTHQGGPTVCERRVPKAAVLVADCDTQVARILLEVLARRGILAHVVEDWRGVLHFVDRNVCDAAFVAWPLVGHAGQLDPERLRQLRVNQPELPVILMAGPQDVVGSPDPAGLLRAGRHFDRLAREAGLYHVLIKPLVIEEVRHLVETVLSEGPVPVSVSAEPVGGTRIVGHGPDLVQVLDKARRIAPTSAPVLISGESGTGKELLAALIHQESRRRIGPYVRVNCAALSESLLESELFGHEKGAFTGAQAQRKGRFEIAHGGTLLLDEISETPMRFQAKLLRILEQQEFERVGGHQTVRVNVRVLSTTNRILGEEVRAGRFRQDLYYRLGATGLTIPPLRRRREDLADLIWHFVGLYARESGRHVTDLDAAMMDLFYRYSWPGNVRQLRNVVRTALILGQGPVLGLDDPAWLMDDVPEADRPVVEVAPDPVEDRRSPRHDGPEPLGGQPLDRIERRAILETLHQTGGNRKKAAEVLGISDRTLREKIRRYRQQELVPA